MSLSEKRILEKLKKIDTPTITNVVATYKTSLRCYDAWYGEWYTDASVKCMFPEYGSTVGYAATVVYTLKSTIYSGFKDRWSLENNLDKTKKPIVLVAKQDFPPKLADRVGLFGTKMTSLFKALGVVGVISDGPMRDIGQIREIGGVQYLVRGLAPGHGDFTVRDVGVPVTVAGMTVMPGDVIHMDVHGACKFPAKYMTEVLGRAQKLLEEEGKYMARLKERGWTLAKWKEQLERNVEGKS